MGRNKQHLEPMFRNSMKQVPYMYFIKLQSNMLSHTRIDGDFEILPDHRPQRYRVECKEVGVTVNNFSFSRLSQEEDLWNFDARSEFNISYVMILFWNGNVMNSECYALTISAYKEFKKGWHKKSITRDEAKEEWHYYRIEPLKGSIFKVSGMFQ